MTVLDQSYVLIFFLRSRIFPHSEYEQILHSAVLFNAFEFDKDCTDEVRSLWITFADAFCTLSGTAI